MDFGALSGQIRVIPLESDSVAEVNIHRYEVIGVGMVALHVLLICREHQCSIPVLSLGVDSCNAWGWIVQWLKWCINVVELSICLLTCGELLFQNFYCFLFHYQIFPKYLVSVPYHADTFPFGMSRLKTWEISSSCTWSRIVTSISSRNFSSTAKMWVCRYL